MKRLLHAVIPIIVSIAFFLPQQSVDVTAPINNVAKSISAREVNGPYAPGEILVKFKRSASKASIEALNSTPGSP